MAAKPPRTTPEPSAEQSNVQSYTDELAFRKARYSQIEYEMDNIGRRIGVRRIKLSEQTRLTAMTPDLGGMDEVQNPETGNTMLIPQRAQYFIVAMVCAINDSHIPFARNRGELDAVMDRLDKEGMDAAGRAVSRLIAADQEEGEDPLDKAKNSLGTLGLE